MYTPVQCHAGLLIVCAHGRNTRICMMVCVSSFFDVLTDASNKLIAFLCIDMIMLSSTNSVQFLVVLYD